MKARVTVTLKSGVLDPQGKAIEGALRSLGIPGVRSVRQGKIFDIDLEAGDQAEAESVLRRASERLLANTVVESYRIEVGDVAAAAETAPGSAAGRRRGRHPRDGSVETAGGQDT